MSQHSHEDDVIPHGGAIVERFGGIRPMASKLNVPVTTVQGWKKRDAIPAIRREEILNAAATYDVDLKGLIGEEANENTRGNGAIAEDPALSNVRPMPQPAPQPKRQQYFSQQPAQHQNNTGGVDMRQIKSIARRTSFITTSCLVALVAGAGFLLFGGDMPQNPAQERITQVETRVSSLERTREENSPGMIQQSIASLQQKVEQISSASAGLGERLNALEAQLRAGGTPALAGVADQLQQSVQTPQGAADWTAAMEDLRGIVTTMQGRMDGFDSALQLAKSENDALGRTLADVSGRDLGAAAMLLTLTQVRSSIDRQTPFADDLNMLRTMAGSADPELAASIEKLAPYAEDGVLSPQALKRELQASANDIITAKLKGEDVSIKEKIMGRLQGLFSIKKDGVDVAGGKERALIDQASAQLDAGDVQGAMATLQQLDGKSAAEAQQWQTLAAGTVAAQGLESQLVKSIVTKLRTTVSTMGSSASGITAGSAPINMAPMAQQPVPAPEPAPTPMEPQAAVPAPEQPAPQPQMYQEGPLAQPVPQQDVQPNLYISPESLAPQAGDTQPDMPAPTPYSSGAIIQQ